MDSWGIAIMATIVIIDYLAEALVAAFGSLLIVAAIFGLLLFMGEERLH